MGKMNIRGMKFKRGLAAQTVPVFLVTMFMTVVIG